MRVHEILLLLLAAALGLTIWFTFPGLTGRDRPYDDKEFWFCVIATSAVVGFASSRRGWLGGLAVTVPQFLLLAVELVALQSPYAWRGFLVFLAFTALCTCTADLATTLRRIVTLLLQEPRPAGVYATDLDS